MSQATTRICLILVTLATVSGCFNAGTTTQPSTGTDAALSDAAGVDADPADATGTVDTDGRPDTPDDPADVAADAGPCGGTCAGETPFCDAPSGVCVACVAARCATWPPTSARGVSGGEYTGEIGANSVITPMVRV